MCWSCFIYCILYSSKGLLMFFLLTPYFFLRIIRYIVDIFLYLTNLSLFPLLLKHLPNLQPKPRLEL